DYFEGLAQRRELHQVLRSMRRLLRTDHVRKMRDEHRRAGTEIERAGVSAKVIVPRGTRGLEYDVEAAELRRQRPEIVAAEHRGRDAFHVLNPLARTERELRVDVR